jgi:uncharacterized integral membrane protein
MWIFRWVILLLVVFLLVGFLSQNSDDKVMIRLMGWESPELPLSFMLFLAALAGYIVSLLVAIINQIRLRAQISAMRRENREVREELDRLRNFALEEEEFKDIRSEESPS